MVCPMDKIHTKWKNLLGGYKARLQFIFYDIPQGVQLGRCMSITIMGNWSCLIKISKGTTWIEDGQKDRQVRKIVEGTACGLRLSRVAKKDHVIDKMCSEWGLLHLIICI